MKIIPLAALGLVGLALAFVALRAPARDYVAPTALDLEAHHPAPQTLIGDIPEGCRVATIEVEGMCCTGCTGKLYEKLRATPGFVRGAVSFEEGLARVVIPAEADSQPFVGALHFGKYAPKLRL